MGNPCGGRIDVGPAVERLNEAPVEKIILSDSIPMPDDRRPNRTEIASLAPMLAKAIDSIHRSESVSRLFEKPFWK